MPISIGCYARWTRGGRTRRESGLLRDDSSGPLNFSLRSRLRRKGTVEDFQPWLTNQPNNVRFRFASPVLSYPEIAGGSSASGSEHRIGTDPWDRPRHLPPRS